MTREHPIATAPRDGRKVTVHWTDRDGQENESIAQYRSLDRLRTLGGDWDASDEGWWAFIDGDTQKRIQPHSWSPPGDDEEDDE
jgi:hypothetical protein